MIENSLSTFWNSLAPAAANHLWQSTLVAAIAGLFALGLRKYHARARYWLWLAASLKFLLPFSMLIAVGRYLAWSRPAPAVAQPGVYTALEEITQPFAPPVMPVVHHIPPAVTPTIWSQAVPILVVLWLLGFLAVVGLWAVRWRRISRMMNSGEMLDAGRELSALRRLEHLAGIRKPIPLLLSRSSLEPGIFGIAHPVLLWPEGISHRLEDAHLEAILAHEVWHVRRRDNLFALLQMLVEAVFWFYPLVWWLGARLVEERERACDEEVIALRGDRQVYAESILKVCEFCLGSPLVCVSGVTGADLKQRMVHIMSDRRLYKLDLTRKLLLGTSAFLAIAVPTTFGLFHAAPTRAQTTTASSNLSASVFSSVSITRHASTEPTRTKMFFSLMDGSFVANGVTLERLIQVAYRIQDAQISGPSDLLNKTKFDLEAKLDPSFVAAMHQQISAGKKLEDQNMLKSLLADRFKLVAHFETRNMAAYDLIADEGGTKLQPVGDQAAHAVHLGNGELSFTGAPLELLTAQLSARLGVPVVDKTGLKGAYAFNLRWTPDKVEDEHLAQSGEPFAPEPPADSNGPSLVTALQQQLGLRLEPQTEPVQVLVIDHVEEPSQD